MEDLFGNMPAIVLATYVLLNKYAPDLFKTSKEDGVKCVTPEDFKELEKRVDKHGEDISYINGKISNK